MKSRHTLHWIGTFPSTWHACLLLLYEFATLSMSRTFGMASPISLAPCTSNPMETSNKNMNQAQFELFNTQFCHILQFLSNIMKYAKPCLCLPTNWFPKHWSICPWALCVNRRHHISWNDSGMWFFQPQCCLQWKRWMEPSVAYRILLHRFLPSLKSLALMEIENFFINF